MKVKLNDIEVVVVKDTKYRVGCADCVFSANDKCPVTTQELEAGLEHGCVQGDHHYEAT